MKKNKNKSIKAITKAFKDQHAQFLEEGEFIKSALSYIYTDEATKNVKKTINFIEKKIIHLDNEEESLFRILTSKGNLKTKRLVRELQHEHINILSVYDEIKDIILNKGFVINDGEARERYVGLVKELLELFLDHARKEDENLFPVCEARHIKVNLHF